MHASAVGGLAFYQACVYAPLVKGEAAEGCVEGGRGAITRFGRRISSCSFLLQPSKRLDGSALFAQRALPSPAVAMLYHATTPYE